MTEIIAFVAGAIPFFFLGYAVAMNAIRNRTYDRGVKYGLAHGVVTSAAVLRTRAYQLEAIEQENLDNRLVAGIYRTAAREIEEKLL